MSLRKLIKSPSGFTIVEVIIVLAIGGMIAAVVFMAVPQLQRSGRDSTRKNIASRIREEIENYASNHEGALPFNNVGSNCDANASSGDWADFYNNYLKNIKIDDPSTGNPVIDCTPGGSPTDSEHSFVWTWPDQDHDSGVNDKLAASAGVVDIVANADCKDVSLEFNSGSGVYAIVMGLDKGNHLCIDNT